MITKHLFTKMVPVVCAALCILPGVGMAADEGDAKDLTLAAQVDFQSAYMFRGQDLFDGAGIQPGLTAEYSFGDLGTTGANAWSHFSADDNYPAEKRFTEIDYTLYHNIKLDPITLGGGIVWYTYPDGDDDLNATREWFLKAALDAPLSPSVTYYRDFDEYQANFFVLGVSHEISSSSLGEGVSVTPFANGTFVDGAEGLYEKDGLAHVAVGTSASFSLGSVGVVPALSYNFKIDDTTADKLWLTLSIKYNM